MPDRIVEGMRIAIDGEDHDMVDIVNISSRVVMSGSMDSGGCRSPC